jgi:nuclear GTP-binding protein
MTQSPSVGDALLSLLRRLNSELPLPVEEILARTQTEVLMRIYNLPTFTSTLEFLTMLALSTGRLLKASPLSPLPPPSKLMKTFSSMQGGTPDILTAARQVLIDWNNQKIPFFSEPPAIHATHIPSTIPGSGGQVAPGAETTGQAQIVSALGAPFVLEGLFGEADAEAMDDEPNSEQPAADNANMDVEGDVRWGTAVDGGMIIDDDDGGDNNASIGNTPCVFQPPSPRREAAKNVDAYRRTNDIGLPPTDMM